MKNSMVSIIVPVYNVELYLCPCIDSILNQTYKNIQLILVDDGSPDNCGTICDEYMEKDRRVLALHKENGGVSSARNLGLEYAEGKYVTFCDSDDAYAADWIEQLVRAIEENKADTALGCFVKVFKNGTADANYTHEIGVWEIDAVQKKVEYCFDKLMSQKHGWEITVRLFSREIIEKNQIRFCENCGNYAEDLGFALAYSLGANCIASVDYGGYYYNIREDSMMQTSASVPKLESLHQVFLSVEPVVRRIVSSDVAERLLPVLYVQMIASQFISKVWSSGMVPDDLRKAAIAGVGNWPEMQKRLNLPLKRVWNPYCSGSRNAETICHIQYLLEGSWTKLRIQCKLIRMFHPLVDAFGKMANTAMKRKWWREGY